MARTAATFKQSDLTRALKGAKAAGVDVARIKIGKDGSIEIDTGKPQGSESDEGGSSNSNPWDTI